MTETFYDVLGVDEDATTDEIQTAYRECLKQTHPDVNDDDDAGQETQTLIEARDVLVDEDERERYDRLGHEAYVGDDTEQIGTARADSADSWPSGNEEADEDSTTSQSKRQTSTDEREGRAAEQRERATDQHRQTGKQQRHTREQAKTRAERERNARERVSWDRSRTTEATDRHDETTQQTTDRHGETTQQTTDRHGETTQQTTDRHGETTANSTAYSVRDPVETDRSLRRFVPRGHDLTQAAVLFALYPVLLFNTIFPVFPLIIHVIVGLCTIAIVGYLQSMPRVALPVFGGWSLLMPFVLAFLNVELFSLFGLAALSGTWGPFGFSLLTAWALRL